MSSKLEIILSPYCAGILNEKDNQYIVVKRGRTEEDATLHIAATSTEGLKKQREHLNKFLTSNRSIANTDKKELEVVFALIDFEITKRESPATV